MRLAAGARPCGLELRTRWGLIRHLLRVPRCLEACVLAGLCMEAKEVEAAEAADRAEAKRLRATGRAAVEALAPALRL